MTRQTVLVLGGSGLVGSRARELWRDDFDVVAPSHAELDVLDPAALSAFVEQSDAAAVLNVAAWADVDGAETERADQTGRVFVLNATYPGRLAQLCADANKYLLHVSTDYVFDGTSAHRPYTERDATNPLCWYAITKAEGEKRVLASDALACVARIEMPFSAHEHAKQDIARAIRARLSAGEPVGFVSDQRITPVFLDDAVRALSALVRLRFGGLIHVAATDWTTPFEFARSIAARLNLPSELIRAERFDVFAGARPARRPQHSWLDVSLFRNLCADTILRSVEAELDAWAEQVSSPARGTQRA